MKRAGIVAGKTVPCEKAFPNLSYAELVFEPLSQLMDELEITHDDIGTVITCSSDFFDGRTISDMSIQDVTGSPGKSASKVSNDATFAMLYAWMRILSGEYDTCLLVAHAKPSEGNQPVIENAAFDPLWLRHLGLTNVTASALQARVLIDSGAFGARDFALAASHDLACAGNSRSVEEVLASKLIADPIHELEAAPYADGAACLLLASEDWIRKRKIESGVTWLAGAGHCTEAHYLGERDLAQSAALKQAATRAFESARVKAPKEIAHAELSAHFSYQLPLWLRELGFLEGGSFAEFLERDGAKINASGGLMAANPGFAAGLYRILEVSKQLKSGERGLAHGINGPLGQSHCVWVLEAGDRS